MAKGHHHRRNTHGEMCEVVSFTSSCTGCCEIGEYGAGSENFVWDDKAKCRIGTGCEECGYTGKRRSVMYIPLTHLV
jgi:hypothetical protein